MTIIILHDGKAWAIGASPEAVGEDCRKLGKDSPKEYIDDWDRRVRFIFRALEVLGVSQQGAAGDVLKTVSTTDGRGEE